jgi:hypothetical protein
MQAHEHLPDPIAVRECWTHGMPFPGTRERATAERSIYRTAASGRIVKLDGAARRGEESCRRY